MQDCNATFAASFGRIKQRNTQRLQEAMKSSSLLVIFNCNPVEFTDTSAILEVQGELGVG